jgi:hypothetical protein
MSSKQNERVDVNTPTGSYTVDDTVRIMEQETITKTTVEYIIVREGDSEPTPSVLTADNKIRYTFPLTGMVSIVRKTTTTTEEVVFNDTTSTVGSSPPENPKPRKPRKKETVPRAVCRATCCGAPRRRKSSIDGFCFVCRFNSASRGEVNY